MRDAGDTRLDDSPAGLHYAVRAVRIRRALGQSSMLEPADSTHESQSDFRRLMEDVAAGSKPAIERLLSEHRDPIYRVIRRRLNRLLRRRYDSDDFAQVVWASFFRNHEQFGRFNSADELVKFLQTVAANKVIDECRRLLETRRHDVRKERSPEECGVASFDQLPSDEPTPSAAFYAKEQIERLPEGVRQMLSLRIAGGTYVEIAQELGVAESTVRRTLRRLTRDRAGHAADRT